MGLEDGMIARVEQMRPRIEAIEFCSHCGEPGEISVGLRCCRVDSWKKASDCYRHSNWETATLEANNWLHAYLYANHRVESRQWNVIACVGGEFLRARIRPRLLAIQREHGLDAKFIGSVEWDLLGAIMEVAYEHCNVPRTFFQELLSIHEQGHLPCGWECGEWPVGNLVVF